WVVARETGEWASTPTEGSGGRDCPERGKSKRAGQDDREASSLILPRSPHLASDRRTGLPRTAPHQRRSGGQRRRSSESPPSVRARASFAPPRGRRETAARGANRPCAGLSARRHRGRRRDPKRHLEEACHFWCPVPQVVVLVSPFTVDLFFPRLERGDPALERLALVRQPKDFGF